MELINSSRNAFKFLFFTFTGRILLLTFLIGLALRLYRLGNLPHGFYVEEMTNTYVGRFILLNGKDLWGNNWPLLYFDKFGDFPPILPIYLSGLSTFIFGVTEFAGRFPIALLGTFTIFPMYSLFNILFKSKSGALTVALLTAILPWHVVLSRTTAEGVVGMFAFVYGLVFLLDGIKHKKHSQLWYGIFCFFSCYFLYPGLRILVPMTLFIFPIFIYKLKLPFLKFVSLATICFVMLTILISSTSWGRARFEQTSLFNSVSIREQIQIQSNSLSNNLGSDNVLRARIFHNKIVLYGREFLQQYLAYFSPKYLFLQGGGQLRYYNVPDQGLLYITILLLLIFALIPKKSNYSSSVIFSLYLLFIAPISAAITVDFPPHVHRSMYMIIPLLLLSGYGFMKLTSIVKHQKILICVGVILLCFEVLYFWNQYAYHADKVSAVFRNDGDRELMSAVIKALPKYDKVVMSTFERLPLYYAFYTKNFSPQLIGTFKKELRIDQIDKIAFVEDECPSVTNASQVFNEKILFIDFGKCINEQAYYVVNEVSRLDGSVAYRLLEKTNLVKN